MTVVRGPHAEQPTAVLLFSDSYPYEVALEGSFIQPELSHLRAVFDRLVVIPSRRGGSRAITAVDSEVEEGLAATLASVGHQAFAFARAAASPLLWRELRQEPVPRSNLRGLWRLFRYVAKAELTRSWTRAFMKKEGLDASACVAYTFWCEALTTGLVRLKHDLPGLTVVSRAHGGDLYAERYEPAYLPCRSQTLARLDRLYPDSASGVRYVAERHPAFRERCYLARMGVPDPGFRARSSQGTRRVVASCSRIVPLKRVDLIGRAVGAAAELRHDLEFEWHHFGDGDGREQLEGEIRKGLPANASAHLHGFESVEGLMRFYATYPVDLFVNASTSEGTPVALMEAASCGIPILATAVGGNQEIVDGNGRLVPPDANVHQIGAAIVELIDEPDRAATLRQRSREVWESSYDAALNYEAFAGNLLGLLRDRAGTS